MFKIKVFVLISLLSGLTLNAQSDFRAGYVILASGDTLHGEINLKGNLVMSRNCIFRTEKNGEETTFSPDDLTEFRMDNGRYFVTEYVGNNEKVFLEFLVKGKLSLYKYSGNGKSQFYLLKEGDTIRELPQDPEYVYKNGSTYVNPPLKAMRLLSYLTTEAPLLQEEIKNTNMTSQRELVRFAVDYHKSACNNQECLVFKNEVPFKVSVRPQIGNVWFFKPARGCFEIGSSVYFWLPVESERLYLRTGLFFGSLQEEFDGIYAKIPIGFRYLAPSHRIRPEISAGPEIYIGGNNSMAYLFNLSGALNVSLKKDKLYWTLGGGISTTPIAVALIYSGIQIISATAFTGLYFKF